MEKGQIKQILDEATCRQSEMSGFGTSQIEDSNRRSIKEFCQNNSESPFKRSSSPIAFDKKIDINKQFKFIATIGKGAYGSVFLVENQNGAEKNQYAIKVLKFNNHYSSRAEKEEHIKNLTWELQIMEQLQGSPFIIALYGNLYQKSNFYFIMEYVNGGDLFFHIRKARQFTPQRAKFYAAELVLALEFMHQNGVIYRDLKPENVLIDSEGHIKIIDFGLSNFRELKEEMYSDSRSTVSRVSASSGRSSIFENNLYGAGDMELSPTRNRSPNFQH